MSILHCCTVQTQESRLPAASAKQLVEFRHRHLTENSSQQRSLRRRPIPKPQHAYLIHAFSASPSIRTSALLNCRQRAKLQATPGLLPSKDLAVFFDFSAGWCESQIRTQLPVSESKSNSLILPLGSLSSVMRPRIEQIQCESEDDREHFVVHNPGDQQSRESQTCKRAGHESLSNALGK
jgi:hypothetical protein